MNDHLPEHHQLALEVAARATDPDAVSRVLDDLVLDLDDRHRHDRIVTLENVVSNGRLRFVGSLYQLGPVRMEPIVVDMAVADGAESPGDLVAWGDTTGAHNNQGLERAWRRGRLGSTSWVQRYGIGPAVGTPARLQNNWSEALKAFLASPGKLSRFTAWSEQDQRLPISVMWDYTFAVDGDGEVWAYLDEDLGGDLDRYYGESPARVRVMRHRQGALNDGARTYPWLRAWAGPAPGDALPCCRGPEVPAPIVVSCCGNAGWRTPEDATAQGEDDAMTDEVARFVFHQFAKLKTPIEVEAQGLAFAMEKGPPVLERWLKRNAVSDEASALLSDGWDAFYVQTARRMVRDHEPSLEMNRCRRCNGLPRTPQARQCRWCGHDWHEMEVSG